MGRQRVGVMFGGRSGEHEVSLASAFAVMGALDPERYDVVPIGLDRHGAWLVGGDAWPALRALAEVAIGPGEETRQTPRGVLDMDPGARLLAARDAGGFQTEPAAWLRQLDVVFPVLHGTYGEDGTLQGLLELAGVPYVGAGVAASALCMDKILCKRVLAGAGIPQVRYRELVRSEWEANRGATLAAVESIGYPCFVKPANLGSSVGIAKAHDRAELAAAIDDACCYDRRVILEEGLEGIHEIEVAVLGNEHPEASVCGEIVPCHEFYDYDAKYLAGESEEIIPASLPDALTDEIRELACLAYLALDIAGMARIDFMVTRDTHQIYLNEPNTLPGFTPISMYPKLWAATGLPFAKLIERLLALALERHEQRQRNQVTR